MRERNAGVCLWTEPGGYAIDVWNGGDTLALVRIGSASSFVPPMAGRALRREHDRSVERMALARAIRRAVDELFQRASGALAHPHWEDSASYAAALAELREIVR